jgi:DNA-binding NtrC family response regulator
VAKARRAQDAGFYKLAEKTSDAADARFGATPGSRLLRGHVLHNLHRFREAEAVARGLVAERGFAVDLSLLSDALVEQALEGENTALPTFVEARNQFELNYLRKLLQITKGNVTHAARMAGRNRTEFYKLLSRHELEANDFKE